MRKIKPITQPQVPIRYSPCFPPRPRPLWVSLPLILHTWSRKWQPTPIFLPGEFHGQRSLAGYNPWGSKQLDTAECNNVLHVLTPWSPHRIFFKHFNISFLPCAIIACLCAPHTLPFSPHLHPFILLMSIILHRATYTSPPPGNLPRFPKLVPLPMQLYSPCSLYVSFIVSMAIVTPYLILSSNV